MTKKMGRPKRKTGTVLMAVGGILLCAALSLFGFNQWDNSRAEKVVAPVVQALEQQIAAGQSPSAEESRKQETAVVDGRPYIGVLSIPAIGRTLPVLSQWSYPNLRVSPCLYAGSVLDSTMVIAGHNYAGHFGNLKDLKQGDAVSFTEIGGKEHRYRVQEVVTLQPGDTAGMLDTDYALTLFTCTYSGRQRVAVRCQAM